MINIAFSGSMNIKREDVFDFMDRMWNRDIHVLVGDCPTGMDRWVHKWCLLHGIEHKRYFAEWDTQGKLAGPIRNGRMVHDADQLYALWDGKSKGTRNCINQALDKGISVHVEVVDGD